MAQKTDAQLTSEANVIKNETTAGANTANRVGTMFIDSIDSKINIDAISTDTSLGTSNTLVPSQNAVKTYVDNHSASTFSFETLYVTGGSPSSANLITKTFTNVAKDTGSYVKLPPTPSVGDIYYISNIDTSLNLWVASGSNNIYNAGTNSGSNLYNCGTTSNRIYVFQYVDTNIWITWKLTSN